MASLISIPALSDEMKLRFASAFVRTGNAAAAALKIIENNPGEALRQSNLLLDDPFVIAEIDRIKQDGSEDDNQPTRTDIAADILARAKETKDPEDYSKLMKLYCDIRGFIEKPGSNVSVDVKVAPVMVVRDKGTDEEWAKGVAEQQRRLVIDATH